jgi:hypothetical protein
LAPRPQTTFCLWRIFPVQPSTGVYSGPFPLSAVRERKFGFVKSANWFSLFAVFWLFFAFWRLSMRAFRSVA